MAFTLFELVGCCYEGHLVDAGRKAIQQLTTTSPKRMASSSRATIRCATISASDHDGVQHRVCKGAFRVPCYAATWCVLVIIKLVMKASNGIITAGITGGFAPPTPLARFALTREQDKPHIDIQSSKRVDGVAAGPDSFAEPELKQLSLSKDDTEKLVSELYGILKDIPTESPPGSEDIYGLDTGIMWGSDSFTWANGGPGGCGTGTSEVQASDEDKTKFKRAVAIVEELVKRGDDRAEAA